MDVTGGRLEVRLTQRSTMAECGIRHSVHLY